MSVVLEARERLLSVKEAARQLEVNPSRVRQLVREGRIRAYRVARDLVIPESEVRRYQATRRPYRKRR